MAQNRQDNFTWTPIDDTCQILECPFPSFSHASVSGDSAPWVVDKEVTVTCDSGFVVKPDTGAEADSFVAKCVAGTQTGGPLRVWHITDSAGTPYSSVPQCSNRESKFEGGIGELRHFTQKILRLLIRYSMKSKLRDSMDC